MLSTVVPVLVIFGALMIVMGLYGIFTGVPDKFKGFRHAYIKHYLPSIASLVIGIGSIILVILWAIHIL